MIVWKKGFRRKRCEKNCRRPLASTPVFAESVDKVFPIYLRTKSQRSLHPCAVEGDR